MINDVKNFYTKFDLPTSNVPVLLSADEFERRVKFITEELNEFVSAHKQNDLVGAADGLIDLVYVILGTAIQMGLPWKEIWDEVHSTNMKKVKRPSKRSPHDVGKPDDWTPPNLSPLLKVEWEEIFMRICSAISLRSFDQSTRVGACVVDSKNCIVSTGFNGPPRTARDSKVPITRPHKYPWIIHAEENAMIFAIAARGQYTLEGCVLYTTAVPCSKCVRLAAHFGIKKIVYGSIAPAMCNQDDQSIANSIAENCGVMLQNWTK